MKNKITAESPLYTILDLLPQLFPAGWATPQYRVLLIPLSSFEIYCMCILLSYNKVLPLT